MLTATTVLLALTLTAAPPPTSPRPQTRPATTRSATAPPASATTPRAAPSQKDAMGRRSWWHASYLLDWGLVVGLIGATAGVQFGTEPHQRGFDPNDPRISRPLRENTVPDWAIIFPATLPLLAIGLAQIREPSWHDVHHATLGLMETVVLTFLSTVALKRAFGRLRPDFLARCQPLADGTCSGDPDLVKTGRESFPSGHASLFFAGGTYLSLYLWGKLKPFRTGGALWKMLVLLAPLAAATAVGVTRISDYRHHWEDVLVGALLGSGFAGLGYRLNFPWPWSKKAGHAETRTRWAALPIVGPGTAGLSAQGTF